MGTMVFGVEAEPGGDLFAARADAGDGELVLARVVEEHAAEIDGQFVLEPRGHHLEDAAQVLALADGVRDARQQREALQLFADAAIRAPAAR